MPDFFGTVRIVLHNLWKRFNMVRMALDYAASLPGPAGTLGGRIRQARRYAELSQEALAHEVEMHRDSIVNWEKDRISPTVDSLLGIARATHFPVRWFVGGLDDDEWAPWGSNPRPMDCVSRLDPNQLELLPTVTVLQGSIAN